MNKSIVSCIFCAIFASTAALADEAPALSRCVDISVPRSAVEAHGGRWIELTSDQWQFLRGVFVINPATPPGLPYGDRAVLAQIDGDPGGLVFFIDGNLACTPMQVPEVLLSMMRDVATSNISHEAGRL
jgi:hypothetical protein